MHPNSGSRRHHSPEFKSKVLAACAEPGASISGVALAHGLNTNLVRKWRSGRDIKLCASTIAPSTNTAVTSTLSSAAPRFVAVEVPAYFSPSWTAFQADRGRDFSVIVDGVSD